MQSSRPVYAVESKRCHCLKRHVSLSQTRVIACFRGPVERELNPWIALPLKPDHSQGGKEYFKWKCFIYLFFLGMHLWHMEVPRLGVESELQLSAYATATAMQDPNHNCSLCCSLGQCRVLNPAREARDWTCILMDTSWILNPLSHNGNSKNFHF